MGRRVRDGAKERFWREAVGRQRTSGLTIRAFCRREGFSEHGFHWWRRELERRRTQRAGPAVARRSARRVAVRREPSSTARFVPVTVTSASSTAYEVHLPNGVRVLVYASANEQLVDVLAALERPVC